MIYPNFDKLDWIAIEKRIIKSQYGGGDLKSADQDEIAKSALEDIKANLDLKHPENTFIVRRGSLGYNDKANDIKNAVLKKYEGKLLSLSPAPSRWFIRYIGRVSEVANEEGIMEKLTDNIAGFTIRHLLTKMKIKDYSIPYGRTRTIEKNEDKEVIACAYSAEFGVGCFIAKMKTKYMGCRIERVERHNSLVPISLKEAVKLIEDIKKAEIKKIDINDEDEKAVLKQIEIEEQKEVESEI